MGAQCCSSGSHGAEGAWAERWGLFLLVWYSSVLNSTRFFAVSQRFTRKCILKRPSRFGWFLVHFKRLPPRKILTGNLRKPCLSNAVPVVPCSFCLLVKKQVICFWPRDFLGVLQRIFFKIKTFSKWMLFHYFSSSVNSYIWNNTINFNFLIFIRHKVLRVPKKRFPDIVSLDQLFISSQSFFSQLAIMGFHLFQ